MKKIFATLLCMMFCSCMTDYSATSVLEYKNESSHDIQLIGPVYNKDSQKVADVKYSLPAGFFLFGVPQCDYLSKIF